MLNPENVGKNLKQIMDFLDISQVDLAHKTGLTPAAVSQIIAGQRTPNIHSVCLILEALNIKFERLVK